MIAQKLHFVNISYLFEKLVEGFHVLRGVVYIRNNDMAYPYVLLLTIDDVNQLVKSLLLSSGYNFEPLRIRMFDVKKDQIADADCIFGVIVDVSSARINCALYSFFMQCMHCLCEKFGLQQRFPSTECHAAFPAVIRFASERPVHNFLNFDLFAAVIRPRIRVVAVQAPCRASLHKKHSSDARSVYGAKGFY